MLVGLVLANFAVGRLHMHFVLARLTFWAAMVRAAVSFPPHPARSQPVLRVARQRGGDVDAKCVASLRSYYAVYIPDFDPVEVTYRLFTGYKKPVSGPAEPIRTLSRNKQRFNGVASSRATFPSISSRYKGRSRIRRWSACTSNSLFSTDGSKLYFSNMACSINGRP